MAAAIDSVRPIQLAKFIVKGLIEWAARFAVSARIEFGGGEQELRASFLKAWQAGLLNLFF